jgi:hypothetical protein
MNSIHNVYIRNKYYPSVETYTCQDIRKKLPVTVNCVNATTSEEWIVNTALMVRLTTRKRNHSSFYDVISISDFSSPRHPDRVWGPPNTLFDGYQWLFPRW